MYSIGQNVYVLQQVSDLPTDVINCLLHKLMQLNSEQRSSLFFAFENSTNRIVARYDGELSDRVRDELQQSIQAIINECRG